MSQRLVTTCDGCKEKNTIADPLERGWTVCTTSDYELTCTNDRPEHYCPDCWKKMLDAVKK